MGRYKNRVSIAGVFLAAAFALAVIDRLEA